MDEKHIARFWSYVDKRGTDDCWRWKRSFDSKGYGIAWCGRVISAHRLSWIIANGPIPEGVGYHGACVMHTCDTPHCVNPNHLQLGSQRDNIADCVAKGRRKYARGEQSGMSRMSDRDVAEMRALYSFRKVTQKMLANQFGMSLVQTARILRGEVRVCHDIPNAAK